MNYAIGTPGQEPRFVQAGLERDVQLNVKYGEIYVPIPIELLGLRILINNDGTLSKKDPDLIEVKQVYWNKIKSARDVEMATVTTEKGVFDYDTIGKDNMQTAIEMAAELGEYAPEDTDWTMHDNSVVKVKVQDLKDAYKAGALKKLAVYNKSFDLRTRINDAASLEELSTIEWSFP